ncbi:hypothetical protein E2C01_047014 [Portunus trituberculatus]|uniref:Uncharacterized protein n=1 Tax=Portunus trituberculatus TaxID=210409 RepID=A0A5B7G6B2_PORTR|nr:hypothetical protein [Portunus trituberculatus]
MDAISRQEVALTLLKNLGSSSRSARDRGREAANHSKVAAFGPLSGKFKPRKFAKTDEEVVIPIFIIAIDVNNDGLHVIMDIVRHPVLVLKLLGSSNNPGRHLLRGAKLGFLHCGLQVRPGELL